MESLAERAAERAERAYALLSERIATAPGGRIQLLLTDHADFSNGFATPVPFNRITIYAHPPIDGGSLAYFDDWLERGRHRVHPRSNTRERPLRGRGLGNRGAGARVPAGQPPRPGQPRDPHRPLRRRQPPGGQLCGVSAASTGHPVPCHERLARHRGERSAGRSGRRNSSRGCGRARRSRPRAPRHQVPGRRDRSPERVGSRRSAVLGSRLRDPGGGGVGTADQDADLDAPTPPFTGGKWQAGQCCCSWWPT